MARIKKKGSSGNAKNFLTRSQAVRKLQLPLSSFRRLCILKGIYPREPRSRKRASVSSTPSTTFYYTKDIQYLLHEPLLQKFREQKTLEKKIAKALGRNEVADAVRWERDLKPRVRLDHVVKERYPTFVDALRDLDDALSLLFLFANLPSSSEVPPKMISRCQRLTREFEHYLIRTHSLRKSFLSIKGIYYQASIQGTDILWLVPYRFVQRTGGDVDFRIMATFGEFYTALLGFVNFRLYTNIGLVYPPTFDAQAEEKGAELGAFELVGRDANGPAQAIENGMDVEGNERAQAEADRLLALPSEEQTQNEDNGVQAADPAETAADMEHDPTSEQQISTLDTFAPIDEKADALLQPSVTADSTAAGKLFESLTFFLSRETPRHPLEFILKAFGCKRVGWDSSIGEPGSYCSEDDGRITHQVVDRPDLPVQDAVEDEEEVEGGVVQRKANERVPGRIYVQPQWVWDSINAGELQRPDLYAAGATLPPHLSPWVRPRKGEYDPRVPLEEQETAEEAELDEDVESMEEDPEVEGLEKGGARENEGKEDIEEDEEAKEEDGGMDIQLADSEDEEDSDAEAHANGPAIQEQDDEEFAGFSGSEAEDADDPARQVQAELEAEALGRPLPTNGSNKSTDREKAKAKKSKAEREALEEVERRKGMMSRRKRKMYEKMAYSNSRKEEEAERLRGKRRRVERAQGRTKHNDF